MAETEDQLDGLYELPLDEFTPARDRLAAELQDQGDREAAARVKKLRKPNLSAWVVNQLVRIHRSDVQELLSVGEEVRAAQRAALTGDGAARIREVGGRRRGVVDRLLGRAGDLLAQAGHATGRATLDKVRDTLMAATVEEEAAEAVRVGRLARELAPSSGFDALAGGTMVAPKSAEGREARDRAREARQARQARDQARDAEKAAEDADREARRLEEEAERARVEAERARRRADRAAERAEELRRKAQAPPHDR